MEVSTAMLSTSFPDYSHLTFAVKFVLLKSLGRNVNKSCTIAIGEMSLGFKGFIDLELFTG